MNKLFLIFIVLIASIATFAQTDDWMRVQSDNGEFSIKIPKKYNYLYSDNGVSGLSEIQLKQMNLLTSYYKDTMISVEFYKEKKNVLSELFDRDKYKFDNEEMKTEKIERNGIVFNQLTRKHQNYYIVRQYFASKDYIYILTAASRNGLTETMNNWLNSLQFSFTNNTIDPNLQKFSNLTNTQIEFVSQNVKPSTPQELLITKNATKDSLLHIVKPPPSFTNEAKQNRTGGKVELRIFCLETGFINKIEIVSSLPHGLTWQVISSVLRSKFLPELKKGVPIASQGIATYNFSVR